MTATLDSEIVNIVGIDSDDFNIKVSYIDASGNLKIKQKRVDNSRVLTIATGVNL